MAIIKQPAKEVHVAGLYEPIQALTGDSTGVTITNYGITTLVMTTGEGVAAAQAYTLASPGTVGAHKTILHFNTNSTHELSVTTANKFFGSTKETLTFPIGSTALPAQVQLVAQSSRWAITSISSTGVTLS